MEIYRVRASRVRVTTVFVPRSGARAVRSLPLDGDVGGLGLTFRLVTRSVTREH